FGCGTWRPAGNSSPFGGTRRTFIRWRSARMAASSARSIERGPCGSGTAHLRRARTGRALPDRVSWQGCAVAVIDKQGGRCGASPPGRTAPARHRPGARSARRDGIVKILDRDRILKGASVLNLFTSQTRPFRSRRLVRPLVEPLEDRITPATSVETYANAIVQTFAGTNGLVQIVDGPDFHTSNDANVQALFRIASSSPLPGNGS